MNDKQKSLIIELVIDSVFLFFSLISLFAGVDKSTIILSVSLMTYLEVICIKWEIKNE